MQVLVSHLERNQIFSVDENGGTKSLKQQVSEYFGIATEFILQRYDTEWQIFLDLDDDAQLHSRDRLKVTVLPSVEELPDIPVMHSSTNTDKVIMLYM